MKPIYSILILATALRFISINQSLWLDEAINATAARDRGVVDLITNYSLGDFHPPLYHLILHFWVGLVGDSETALRLPSLIFGLVTVYFTYRIGLLVFKNQTIAITRFKFAKSLLPALFLATSGLHIYYSQEARMYSLAAMFASISIYLLLKLTPNISITSFTKLTSAHIALKSILTIPSVVFIISTALLLLTDYLPWMLLPVLFFALPIQTTLATTLTLPWWPLFAKQLQIGLSTAAQFPGWNQVVGGLTAKNILLIPVKFTIGRVSVDNNLHFALLLAIPLALITILLIRSIKQTSQTKNPTQIFITAWLIAPLIFGIVLSYKISLLSYFRFLFILPAFYLLITHGLDTLKKTPKTVVIFFLLLVNLSTSLAYLFNSSFHRENWRGLAAWIDSNTNTTGLTIFPNTAQAAAYEFYQQTIPATQNLDPQNSPETIYLMRYVQEIFDPTDSKRILLEELGYQRLSTQNFNGIVVWEYQKPSRVYANLFSEP